MHSSILKYLTCFMFLFFIISGCVSTNRDIRTGTGKPKFGSLELEGISYEMTSEKGIFTPGVELKLFLKLKNVSPTVKTFKISDNKLLILVIKNEFSETIKTVTVPANRYLNSDSFILKPGQEKTFEIRTDTSGAEFKENNDIFCQFRLFFLPKQFRRNTLSIYLDKK